MNDEPIAIVPVSVLRRLVDAAPASLRRDPEVAMLAAEIGASGGATPHTTIDPAWMTHALDCVRQAAASTLEITSEDVWSRLKMTPARPNDVGAALTAAAAAGLIEKTDRFKASTTTAVSGGRQKRIWRSLVACGPQASLW